MNGFASQLLCVLRSHIFPLKWQKLNEPGCERIHKRHLKYDRDFQWVPRQFCSDCFHGVVVLALTVSEEQTHKHVYSKGVALTYFHVKRLQHGPKPFQHPSVWMKCWTKHFRVHLMKTCFHIKAGPSRRCESICPCVFWVGKLISFGMLKKKLPSNRLPAEYTHAYIFSWWALRCAWFQALRKRRLQKKIINMQPQRR